MDTIFPKPFYFIAFHVIPKQAQIGTKLVKNLFVSEKDSLKYFLENYKGLRFGGWDTSIRGPYSIDLSGIENQDRLRRIRVSSKGDLIIQAALIPDFLCWGDEKGKRIKQLGLIEFTYNAMVVLKKMLNYIDDPDSVKYVAGFVGLDDNSVYITRGDAYSNIGGIEKNSIKGTERDFDGIFTKEDLIKNEPELSYIIIENIYRMFGLQATEIPFVEKTESGNFQIDVTKIKII